MAEQQKGLLQQRRVTTEHKAHEATGMMRWLLTYADMLTLLFAMFVVLFAMSKVQIDILIKAAQSIRSAMNQPQLTPPQVKQIIEKYSPTPAPTPTQTPASETPEQQRLRELRERLALFLQEKKLEGAVKLQTDERGLVILLLTDRVLFDLGRAELRPEIKGIMDELVKIIKEAKIKNPMRVDGHTCDLPLFGPPYSDNLGLSVARAGSVWRYLVERGIDPRQISAAGYGEFRPLVPNKDEEHRKKNRRVEIIILTEKEKKETLKEVLREKTGKEKEKQDEGSVTLPPPGGGR